MSRISRWRTWHGGVCLLLFLLPACSPRSALQPRWATRTFLSWHSPEVLWFVDVDERVIALTLDDGPHPASTPEILDVLAENGAHATFFILGDAIAGNETLLQRIRDEGHEIGNHGLTKQPHISLSRIDFEDDVREAARRLAPFDPAPWFRPGSGLFDDPMLITLEHLGLTCVLGDVYVVDPALPWPGLISGLVKWSVRPGSIVILHDEGKGGGRGRRTAEVLRRLLPSLIEEGYRIVTVTELSKQTTEAP